MLTLQHAFDACNISVLLIRINAGHYPSPSSSYDVRLRAYLRKLLTTNPTLRWSCDEVLMTDLFRPYVARYARAARPELLHKLEILEHQSAIVAPGDSSPQQQQRDSTQTDLSVDTSVSDDVEASKIKSTEGVWAPISTLSTASSNRDIGLSATLGTGEDWFLVSTPKETDGETEETGDTDKHAKYQAQAAVAKFMLGSQTLQLDANEVTTTHNRIEALRAYLEDHVGDEVTVQAHGMIEHMVYQDAGGPTFADIKKVLGDKTMYLPLVVQLVHAEAFHFVKMEVQ